MVLLIALPHLGCLSLLLELVGTLRGKVTYIFTLEALDMSMIILHFLILAHYIGILILHLMPSSFSSSCYLFLLPHVNTIFMVDLNLILGLDFWLWLRLHLLLYQLLCWAH